MDIYQLLISILIPLIGGILGYFAMQIRDLYNKLDRTMKAQEIKDLVNDKVQPIKEDMDEVRDRMERIENKLDMVLAEVYKLKKD